MSCTHIVGVHRRAEIDVQRFSARWRCAEENFFYPIGSCHHHMSKTYLIL